MRFNKKPVGVVSLVRRATPVIAALLLGGYLVASLGWMPSPAAIARMLGVVQGERFACESCGCGCSSERECWTQCCCHTLAQRVAWAQREGVEIPSYVDLSPLQRPQPEKPLLEKPKLASASSGSCGLCTLGDAGEGPVSEGPVSEDPQERAPLASMSALACKGLTSVLGLAVMPGVWSGGVSFDLSPVPEPDAPSAEGVATCWRSLRVPTPPPRRSA